MAHTPEPLTDGLDPINALRRTAFLMERGRAGSYRVDAFRKALATLKAMTAAQLEEHLTAGTIQSVPGIGKSTAEVVEQAHAGRVPDRLAALQEQARTPLAEGGEELWAAIVGDCHSHSNWSDGGSPI